MTCYVVDGLDFGMISDGSMYLWIVTGRLCIDFHRCDAFLTDQQL